MLDPKEKGNNLVEKFYLFSTGDTGKGDPDKANAKQCALIAQQEKIDLLIELEKEICSVLGTDSYEERDFITAYLKQEEEIKKEIEAL